VISHRFVRAVSLLTIALFLLSASVDVTLERLERSPLQSELAIYSPSGQLQAVYHGDLAQLSAASAANPPSPSMLHRLRMTVESRWL
jgi:hypothetical protein